MAVLSWVRIARRLTSLVRQRELHHLEALLDAEPTRQPAYTYFVLSCAIPAGIATIGGLSTFAAWLSGVTGTPLILGAVFTALLALGSWFTFFRLYRSISPEQRRLRKLISDFTKRYASFGNIILGENPMNSEFAAILDEAAGIYLPYSNLKSPTPDGASAKAIQAIEQAMIKLLEVAVDRNAAAEEVALPWAEQLLEELKLLNQSIQHQQVIGRASAPEDALANLRAARSEVEHQTIAREELDQHINN